MTNWLEADGVMAEALLNYQKGESLCLCTLIASKGSVPQDLGAKLLVTSQGQTKGTIGGGKVEAAVIVQARQLLQGETIASVQTKIWNLQTDLGMSCGGEVTVLFETMLAEAPLSVVVFGAGHIGQALLPLLMKLNVRVHWIDDRQEWLDRGPAENLKLKKIKMESGADLAPVMEKLHSQSFIISITKGHSFDLEILRMVLPRKFPFVGVIGSKTKGLSLRQQLKKEGFSDSDVESFCCPIGEGFGNNQPIEIAFSIVAQILRLRDSLLAK